MLRRMVTTAALAGALALSGGALDVALAQDTGATTTPSPTATTGTPEADAGGTAAPSAPDPTSTTPGAPADPLQPPATTQPAPAPTPAPTTTTTTTAAATTASDDDGGLPPGAIAGIALGALVLLALLLWALARLFAWDPLWAARGRHAVAEAGWHVSGTWADFSDWLRGGRPRRS